MRRELPLSVTVADDAPLCPCVRLCMREWSVCSRNHDTHTTIRYNGVFFHKNAAAQYRGNKISTVRSRRTAAARYYGGGVLLAFICASSQGV